MPISSVIPISKILTSETQKLIKKRMNRFKDYFKLQKLKMGKLQNILLKVSMLISTSNFFIGELKI